MNRFFSARPVLAAAIAIGSLAAASAAHARADVFLSIGVPGVYVQPAPVYVQPQPVYVQPQPVYVYPQPVYDWRHRHHHHQRRHGGWGDADRDGVPNRFDHRPYDPYRR
jgi:hypothetical protein